MATNPYEAYSAPGPSTPVLSGAETCISCGYALAGLTRDGVCPECSTPIIKSVGGIATSTTGRYCIKCAYALDGLPNDGQCPECATSIELSLREPTLANADPAYVLKLRSGLSMVLNGILLMIVVMLGSTIGMVAMGAMGVGVGNAGLVIQVLNLIVSAIILLGYWKYTEPDPSQVALETTKSARTIIRWTVLLQAGIAVFELFAEFVPRVAPSMGTGTPGAALQGIRVVLSITNFVLWAVQFFAVMRYTRWVATRVPDYFIVRRTKKYMWLLPVLYIPGMLLIGLGPLIALVLYWNLLDRLRKHVKAIIKTGHPAALKKMGPTS